MQNQLRIQIDNGNIQYLPDLGFHLMESPDMLAPPQREYETERYPEHDGVKIYPYTTYEPFEYTVKLLFFGSLQEMNAAVTIFWESMFETIVHGGTRRAKEIRLFNDYKGIQIVGYAQGIPGENSYIEVFGSDTDDRNSGWACDFTIFVAEPNRCKWAPDVATITYIIDDAIPNQEEKIYLIGSTITLPTPSDLGMQMKQGVVFSGWTLGGIPITNITVNSDISIIGTVIYNESAFTISPASITIDYAGMTWHDINVTCPNDLWSISVENNEWLLANRPLEDRTIGRLMAAINTSTSVRSQIATFTWTSPDNNIYNREVSVSQSAYTGPSYILTTPNLGSRIIQFDPSNTTIDNLCVPSGSLLTINGEQIDTTNVAEVHINHDYSYVTVAPNGFLARLTNCRFVDISALSNINDVNRSFCQSLGINITNDPVIANFGSWKRPLYGSFGLFFTDFGNIKNIRRHSSQALADDWAFYGELALCTVEIID